MKYFLILPLFLLCLQIGIAQSLLKSRQTSYYTYIYKLSEDEAKAIYKNDLQKVEQWYLHTLVDSIPTDSNYNKKLPVGHYLKTYTEKNKLKFSITTIQDFDVKIINNNTDLNIQVYDSLGNIIKIAYVNAHGKRLHFDEKSQSYRDRKSSRKGLLTVTIDGFSAYYQLDRQYNNSWFKRSSRKILYGIPIKYVWKPIRYVVYLPIDGVRSISRRYPQGTIYRTKDFFVRTYHKVACVFDDYHCDYYGNNSFENKYHGYLVFNKPKYLPQDTVKFKAFIVNKKGKPVRKQLNVVVGDYHKYTKITSLKPYCAGAYSSEFYLHDSLEFKLGGSYKVSLQLNDQKEFISEYFRYEDYELSKIKLELSSESEDQYKGKSFTLSAKGTDENDLNLLDAKLELHLKFGKAFNFYDDSVFVRDTLLFIKKKLDVQNPTEFTIPDSIFPAADLSYNAIVRMTTSDNELVTETLKIMYHHHDVKIDHSLRGDSLHLSFKIDDVEKEITAKIYGVDNFGNKTIQDSAMLPVTIKINPYFSDYLVQNDSLSATISISEEQSLIQCLSERTKDSVRIVIQNPRNIPFNYFVYKRNKEQMRGFGKSFETKFKTTSVQNYFVSIQYLWGGKITDENFRIPYNSKELKINVAQPAIIYPGQHSDIEIEVLDKEGHPVPDVDLTAYSFTKKFNEESPEIPYLGKIKKNKVIINNFHFEADSKAHSEKVLDYKTWKTLAVLDTIDYYQFIYPENKIYQFAYTPEDSITQFSPFVMKNGAMETVHVVYVDSEPRYFSWSGSAQPYSFQIDSGYHQIILRTAFKQITIDSLYFAPHQKLIFSLNDSFVNNHVKSMTYSDRKLTAQEKISLYNHIFPYRNTFGNQFAYIKQGKNVQLLSGMNAYRSTFLAGPVSGNEITFQVVDGYNSRFLHEPFFEYEFSSNLLKMRSVDPKFRYPQEFVIKNPREQLSDLVITNERVVELWHQKLDHERKSQAKYINPSVTLNGAGTLLIDYKKMDKTNPDPLNILLFRYDDHKFIRVYPGTTNTFYNLKKGPYKLIYFYPGSSYFVYDSVMVEPNGLNYHLLRESHVLLKDEFSKTVNDVIEKTIFRSDWEEKENEIQSIREAYQNQFRFTGVGDVIQGYVYEAGTNDPLPGVNVIAKGTTYGTVTDMDGFYSIKVPYGVNEIVISSIGYVSQIVNLGYNDYARIELTADVTALEEIIVVGYGVQSRSNLTGAISVVNESDVSPIYALEGKVAGVTIISSSTSGESVSINIRGANTLLEKTPLYIIDGIIFTGDIQDLKPEYIDQIQILKDANATAIYGARGANGVVLISTKKDTFKATGQKFIPGLDPAKMMAAYGEEAKSIRNNFSDYGFWQPRLKTNSKGKASFSITFPDDVTSWQTFVLAMNYSRQSGQTEGLIKSFKPLMAQVAVPRFLVEGDSSMAIGKVLNYTPDTLALSTTLEINDSIYFTKNKQCINTVIDSLLITPVNTDTLSITYFLKKEDGYFDGEERKIPVIPLGMDEKRGVFYALDTDTTINLTFDMELGDVTLYAKSDILEVLESEIEHVYAYKYDCNEQLASKLKALLALRSIRNYKGEPLPKDKRINQLITAINKNQNKEEQWGWWQESSTNYWISNYVIDALLQAKEQGYDAKINEGVIFDQLFWRLQGQTGASDKIWILKILKRIDAQIDYTSYIKEIKLNNKNSFHDLLLFLDLKQLCGIKTNIDTLNYYSNYTMMGNEYFSDSTESLNIVSNTIQNTLLAYQLLKRDSATSEDRLRKIRHYFLEERKPGHWANTYQSAQIIDAILPDVFNNNQKPISPSIKISGSLNTKIIDFPYQTTLRAIDKIDIVKSGDFPVYLTAYQSGWNPNPVAHRENFEVITYFSNPDTSKILEAGREVTLILDLEVKKDAEYVMIEVPIPAGCTYASEETNYRLEVHREYFKDHTSIFCESLNKGNYRFEIKLLPRYNGNYNLNPAKAELMYFPTFYGNNEIKKVVIE